MNDVLMLYLFTRLDGVLVASCIVGLAGAIWIFTNCMNDMRSKWFVWALVAVPLVVTVIVPSQKDMAVIVGGKIALDAGRSDTGKEIGKEVIEAIRSQLKQATK